MPQTQSDFVRLPQEFEIKVLQYPIKVKLQKSTEERGAYTYSRECETVFYISEVLNDEERFATFIHKFLEFLNERYEVFGGKEIEHGHLTLTSDMLAKMLQQHFKIELLQDK